MTNEEPTVVQIVLDRHAGGDDTSVPLPIRDGHPNTALFFVVEDGMPTVHVISGYGPEGTVRTLRAIAAMVEAGQADAGQELIAGAEAFLRDGSN